MKAIPLVRHIRFGERQDTAGGSSPQQPHAGPTYARTSYKPAATRRREMCLTWRGAAVQPSPVASARLLHEAGL